MPAGQVPAGGPTLSYVLPLRWSDDRELAELTGYLRWLAPYVELIVVDGSPPPVFARHAVRWRGLLRHLPPDPDLTFRNGKVNGVITGVRRARRERVVIADDDVRYDLSALERVARLLDTADLVRPQNHFTPLPWHARWDTGRTLLNRAFGADWPGTFGIRRATFLAMGGYHGDVLFENLELVRTVRAYGGSETRPLDLYVPRRPPDRARFLEQRVRQAYDDLAQPGRLLLFLALLPAVVIAVRARRPGLLAAGTAGVAALAELGRRRAGGATVFPPSCTLFAPAWLAERAVCSWLALGQRLCGGVRYAGSRLTVAAHHPRALRSAMRRRSLTLT